ncbi:MAG: fibronectin type III domain-containing protein, partial [Stackebrandtia sp.]
MADPICFKAYTARCVEFVKVNSLGRPVWGECSRLVSKFVTITATPEQDEGEEVSVKNSDGTACLSVPPCPTLKWYSLEFEFCQVDLDMALFFNPKWRPISNILGQTVGWAEGPEYSCDGGFAAVVYLNAQTDQVITEPGAEGLWFALVFPWMTNGAVSGDQEIGSENINFTFSAKSRLGNQFGRGPLMLQRDAEGNPIPLLVPIDPGEHVAKLLTTVPPPEALCGCQPLAQPDFTLMVTDDATDPTGMTVELDATGVYAASIDWGDNTTEIITRWPAVHLYAAAGTYPITGTDTTDPSRTASAEATVPFERQILDPPAGLAAGTPTDDSVPLTWTATTNATGYQVEYKPVSAETWLAFDPAATTTEQTVTGLAPGTTYDFRVTATDGDAWQNSPPSEPIQATTTGGGTKLAAPLNFAAGTATVDSVPLTWDAVSGADVYTVEFKKTADATWTAFTPDADTNS